LDVPAGRADLDARTLPAPAFRRDDGAEPAELGAAQRAPRPASGSGAACGIAGSHPRVPQVPRAPGPRARRSSALADGAARPTPRSAAGGGRRSRPLADRAAAVAPAFRLTRALSDPLRCAGLHDPHRLAVIPALRPAARSGRRLGGRLREGMEKLALLGGPPVRATFLPYAHHTIEADDVAAVSEALASDLITQGPTLALFERALANRAGVKHAVTFANGTAALHAACWAAGLGASDEAITTPLTFAATANAVVYQGAWPVFADIDATT